MTIYQFLLLFLLWVCLPHFCSPEMMFRRTPVPQQRILGARMPRNDGKILHRQKRGWMWNQFFLLEEYTGSDYQYVGKVSLYGDDTKIVSLFHHWVVIYSCLKEFWKVIKIISNMFLYF